MLGLISNVCLVHEWRVEGYPCLEVITLKLYPHIIMVIIKSIILKACYVPWPFYLPFSNNSIVIVFLVYREVNQDTEKW